VQEVEEPFSSLDLGGSTKHIKEQVAVGSSLDLDGGKKKGAAAEPASSSLNLGTSKATNGDAGMSSLDLGGNTAKPATRMTRRNREPTPEVVEEVKEQEEVP